MNGNARVAVLYGAVAADAAPDEQDALIAAKTVAAALRKLGYQPLLRAVGTNLDALYQDLLAAPPALAFNLVESLAGRGAFIAWVPQVLDALGIAYTGAGADAMYLTSNKLLAKRWLTAHGVPTPPWSEDGTGTEAGAWIVKSAWEHASIGIDDDAIVSSPEAVRGRIARQGARYGGAWFAERYVDGREFNIALLETTEGVQLLPVAEIDFSAFPPGKPRIVSYAAKWDAQAFEYQHTPRRFIGSDSPNSLRSTLYELAQTCWRLFRLRGYARVDVRIDDRGQPWVLEINTNPCLSPEAGFAAAAAQAGMGYAELIGRIVSPVLPPELRPESVRGQYVSLA